MSDLYFQRFFPRADFGRSFQRYSPRNLAYRFGLPCAILRDFFRIKYFEHKNSRSFSAQFLCADFHANFLRSFYAHISTQISCAIFPRNFFTLFPTHFFCAISYTFFFALFSHIQNHVKSVQKPKNFRTQKNIKARANH
jgi:hypothetical protein